MKILEEFYYGNIDPHERPIYKDSEFTRAMALAVRNEEALRSMLNDRQKEMFEKCMSAHTEKSELSERDAFIRGFAFGLRFMAEAYQTTQAEENI